MMYRAMARCTKTRYRDRIAALLVRAAIEHQDEASRPTQGARA